MRMFPRDGGLSEVLPEIIFVTLCSIVSAVMMHRKITYGQTEPVYEYGFVYFSGIRLSVGMSLLGPRNT